ncbi:ATP-binding protein [Shewanella maritima]|uniref:ATP-binding protein n=1 Tax=Shewanella maritima TaxID=2520507 RepID=A0A411PL57_9GAMM|nr:ATP-binding protein [Shewanella maritima]QBF84228.1 ATP-binding protein [Shewanella maritima]
MNTLQLSLSAKLLDNSCHLKELEQFMCLNGVKEGQRFKLITCTMEGLNNALMHGGDKLENIILMAHCSQDKVMIDLLNQDDYQPLPEVNDYPNPNDEGGRGLWIMLNWMDQVTYEPSVLGTHLRMCLLR